MDYQVIIQLIACLLMIIDTIQTFTILRIDINFEANPIIKLIYRLFGMIGVVICKLIISFAPFMAGWYAIGLALVYSYVVYHNYTGLKDYDRTEESDYIH